MEKIFYLGPEASYCYCAMEKFASVFNLASYEAVAKNSILAVIKSMCLEENSNFYAVIPIENSVEGIVRETIDNLGLLKDTDIKIVAETSIPVKHCLVGFADDYKNIDTVVSHPQAIAQCYGFINDNLSESVILKHELSTAAAVQKVSESSPNLVAIGSEFAAQLYGKPIIKSEINDYSSNKTRFILLGKKQSKISANDKTGFSFATPNTPGALCKVLNILDAHGINMTYIDSRPSKQDLGEYVFYVDIDGHALSDNISKAIFEILLVVKDFQYFGSYTSV